MLVLKQRKQVLKNISFFGHLFQYILATVKGEVDPLYHYLGQSELVNHSAESGVDFAGAALRGANRAAVYFAANKINPRNFCRNGIFDSAFNAVYFHIHGAYNANHKFNLAKKECVRPARRIIDKNL